MGPSPLDYASPDSPPGRRPPLTPRQRRFRRRLALAVAAIVVIGMIPFPTEVCPALTVRLADAQGRPLGEFVRFHWEGGFQGWYAEGWVATDPTGAATLARQHLSASAWSRVGCFIAGTLLPHFGSTTGRWERGDFHVPSSFDLDPAAMGFVPGPASPGTRPDDWSDPRTGDHIAFSSYEPTKVHFWFEGARRGVTPSTLTIVLRPRATATTQPAPSSGRSR